MNNRKLVPAYLCVVLIVANCAGGSFQLNEKTPAAARSTQQPGSLAADPPPDKPEPQWLVAAVKRAYVDLALYRSKGIHTEREEFRGKRVENPEVPFEIDYTRGQNAALKWKEADKEKSVKIVGKDSWLEVDGQRRRTFSSPDDALGIAAQTENGDFLFEIKFFVFRDELRLKDKFFAGLGDLESKGEEVVDGHVCYVLTGTYGSVDARKSYWIDKETSVIRRIEKVLVIRTKSEGKEYVSTSTTTENYTDIEIRKEGV